MGLFTEQGVLVECSCVGSQGVYRMLGYTAGSQGIDRGQPCVYESSRVTSQNPDIILKGKIGNHRNNIKQ